MKNLLKILAVCFLLFTAHVAKGQYYEVKYSFNKLDANGKETDVVDNEYQALIYYSAAEDTNVNVMRVRYKDLKSGNWIIVEQNVKAVTITKNGENFYALVGSHPRFISRVPEGYRYYPDMIVLEKAPRDSFYKPSFVASQDMPNTPDSFQIGKLISFRLLGKDDINNDYLGLFSWRIPESKTSQITGGNFDNCTLYLVEVSNTLNPELGFGFSANHEKIKNLFQSAANACRINFKLTEITGYNFSKANVLQAINNLNPGPNDIVIFYYSGHGFRFNDQTTDWPTLAMIINDNDESISSLPQNSLNLGSDIYPKLAAKNPRLLMVVGECCNVNVEDANLMTPKFSNPFPKMAGGGYAFDPIAMRVLMQQRAKILIATSKKGESTEYYSNGDGGVFCNVLLDHIKSEASFTSQSTDITWQNILLHSMTGTIDVTTDLHRQNPTGWKVQDPIYYFGQ